VSEALGGFRRSVVGESDNAEVRIDVSADRLITVTGLDGAMVAELALPPRLHELFMQLATRHEQGADTRSLEARSLAAEDLASALNVNNDTVRRNAHRINDRLRDDAERRGNPPGELVQHMRVEKQQTHRRWLLNVDRVAIDDAGR
jgi:ribosomal protein L28